MPNIGMGELIVVLVIVMLIFGASRLPQIGEGFGKAIRNFKQGIHGDDDIHVSENRKQVTSESSAQRVVTHPSTPSDAEIVERKS